MFKVYPRNMKDMEHFPQRERMERIDIANNIGQIISVIKFRTNIEDLYLKAKGGSGVKKQVSLISKSNLS